MVLAPADADQVEEELKLVALAIRESSVILTPGVAPIQYEAG